MCKGQTKENIEKYGLILTIIYFIFLIVNIFLAGYVFKESHQDWAEGPYNVIGMLLLGFLSFQIFKDKKPINAIVRIKTI